MPKVAITNIIFDNMDSIDDESIRAREHGLEKYGAGGLIASSVDFGWVGFQQSCAPMAAE